MWNSNSPISSTMGIVPDNQVTTPFTDNMELLNEGIQEVQDGIAKVQEGKDGLESWFDDVFGSQNLQSYYGSQGRADSAGVNSGYRSYGTGWNLQSYYGSQGRADSAGVNSGYRSYGTGWNLQSYNCDTSVNWMENGPSYSQIDLTDACSSAGGCAANPVYGSSNDNEAAIAYCKDQCNNRDECEGFFYQKHNNGHEICGFYASGMSQGQTVWGEHQAGAVCQAGADTALTCSDSNTFGQSDSYGDGCEWYAEYPSTCGFYDTWEFTASSMCCACAGGACQDYNGSGKDAGGDGCEWYTATAASWGYCGFYDDDDFVATDMCCNCRNPPVLANLNLLQ